MTGATEHIKAAIAELEADRQRVEDRIALLQDLLVGLEDLSSDRPVSEKAEPVSTPLARVNRGPRKSNANIPEPVRSTKALTTITMAAPSNGAAGTDLMVKIPAEIAKRGGIEPGVRVVLLTNGSLSATLLPSKDKGTVAIRQSAATILIQHGGTRYGLRTPRPAVPCVWRVDRSHHLVIDLPDWWPKGDGSAPGRHKAGNTLTNISREKSSTHAHPVVTDGFGERIESEFPCCTCGRDDPLTARRATMQCTVCGDVFCASCYVSHLPIQKREVHEQQAGAIHA